MIGTQTARCLAFGFMLLPLLFGCQIAARSSSATTAMSTTVPFGTQVSAKVERLAILYPKTVDHELISAYNQLDGAAFQLKIQRPSLIIVDRYNLDTILNEQRLQVTGAVSDATAVHVGRILGADSVLLYHIEAPSMRDRTMARMTGDLSPVLLTSKIILVESGEVVYHNVVTAPVERLDHDQSFFSVEAHLQAALTRGVLKTVADLRQAFR
jgi:hypothetical protein